MTTTKWDPGLLMNRPQVALPQVHTDNLGEVLSGGENSRVAFFEEWNRDAVAKTLAGMYNSQGGTVIVGVGLDGIVLGLDSAGFWEEAVALGDGFEPQQKVVVRRVSAGDSELVTLEVAQSSTPGIAFEGQVFRREGFLTVSAPESAKQDGRNSSKILRSYSVHYRLDKVPLGRGGQAEVFRATHRTSNRKVALKRIIGVTSGRLREPAISRMKREIEVQRMLSHSNIMPVMDYDHLNHAWYVMPEALGSLVSYKTEKRPIHGKFLLHAVENASTGMLFAHQNKYIHRDLSPDNILLIREGIETRWVVSDWGLVRKPRGQTSNQLTKGWLGKELYAPPEAWKDAHELDERADVYAMGRIVAWALGAELIPCQPVRVDSDEWSDFISRTTELDRGRRVPNFEEVLKLLTQIEYEHFDESVWENDVSSCLDTLLSQAIWNIADGTVTIPDYYSGMGHEQFDLGPNVFDDVYDLTRYLEWVAECEVQASRPLGDFYYDGTDAVTEALSHYEDKLKRLGWEY